MNMIMIYEYEAHDENVLSKAKSTPTMYEV